MARLAVVLVLANVLDELLHHLTLGLDHGLMLRLQIRRATLQHLALLIHRLVGDGARACRVTVRERSASDHAPRSTIVATLSRTTTGFFGFDA